jgi:ABC-type lipoprotein release transport system permease subunit
LAEKEEAEQAPKMTPEQRKAQEVAQTAMADPEVRTIVQEPKVQALLQQMQSGQPFELEAAVKSDPEMVRKLRKLSEAGLINMQWMR